MVLVTSLCRSVCQVNKFQQIHVVPMLVGGGEVPSVHVVGDRDTSIGKCEVGLKLKEFLVYNGLREKIVRGKGQTKW